MGEHFFLVQFINQSSRQLSTNNHTATLLTIVVVVVVMTNSPFPPNLVSAVVVDAGGSIINSFGVGFPTLDWSWPSLPMGPSFTRRQRRQGFLRMSRHFATECDDFHIQA